MHSVHKPVEVTVSTDQTIAEIDKTTEAETVAAPAELAAEDLIEEVSIDGMCGVY